MTIASIVAYAALTCWLIGTQRYALLLLSMPIFTIAIGYLLIAT